MKPITVTVDYMRGGTPRDTFATAEIQRLGSRIANVEAIAWQIERQSRSQRAIEFPARRRRKDRRLALATAGTAA